MHTERLDTEHITEIQVDSDSLVYLQDNGYSVDCVEHHVVVSDSEKGYIVSKVETHTKPLRFADAVEDKYTLYICTCPAYRFKDGLPNLMETDVTEWTPCKHCKAVDKSLKASADESQTQL